MVTPGSPTPPPLSFLAAANEFLAISFDYSAELSTVNDSPFTGRGIFFTANAVADVAGFYFSLSGAFDRFAVAPFEHHHLCALFD